MHRALRIAAALLAAYMMKPSVAMAEEPPPVPPATLPPHAEGTPDVVELRAGGFVRGRIVELFPGKSVEIVTPSGKVYRFEMADVTYAGPDRKETRPATAQSSEVAPPSRAANVPLSLATVSVLGNEPGLRVLWRTPGARDYQFLCAAPCKRSVAAAAYDVALVAPSGTLLDGRVVDLPPGPSTLRAAHHSNAGGRTLGWVILVASVAGGLGLASTGFFQTSQRCGAAGCEDKITPNGAMLAGGLGLVAVGSLLGLLLIHRHDSAQLRLESPPR